MVSSNIKVVIGLALGLIVGFGIAYGILQSQVTTLESQVTSKNTQISNLQSQVSSLQSQVAILQDTIDAFGSLVPLQPPTDGENGSSRFFPAEIGVNLTSTFEDWGDAYVAVVSVNEVIRGDDAWTIIEEEYMFNDPPESGFEYILIRIMFEYVSGPTIDTLFNVDEWDFDVISSEGYEYEIPSVFTPEPELDASLYPGASYEGWCTYQVYETDDKPVLTFGRDFSGSGGIWFKLYSES